MLKCNIKNFFVLASLASLFLGASVGFAADACSKGRALIFSSGFKTQYAQAYNAGGALTDSELKCLNDGIYSTSKHQRIPANLVWDYVVGYRLGNNVFAPLHPDASLLRCNLRRLPLRTARQINDTEESRRIQNELTQIKTQLRQQLVNTLGAQERSFELTVKTGSFDAIERLIDARDFDIEYFLGNNLTPQLCAEIESRSSLLVNYLMLRLHQDIRQYHPEETLAASLYRVATKFELPSAVDVCVKMGVDLDAKVGPSPNETALLAALSANNKIMAVALYRNFASASPEILRKMLKLGIDTISIQQDREQQLQRNQQALREAQQQNVEQNHAAQRQVLGLFGNQNFIAGRVDELAEQNRQLQQQNLLIQEQMRQIMEHLQGGNNLPR